MLNLQNQIFCKFRGLDKDIQKDCELNSRFYDILENRRLYGASFNSLNDIDEGRFFVSTSQSKLIKEIRGSKEEFKICCLSFEEEKLDLDLMWAHYGNGHCGVKIDFRISEAYEDEIFKVSYGKKPKEYSEQELECIKKELMEPQECDRQILEDSIKKILTNKKRCFAYENEYRAIWKEGGDYLPIQILKITLGKQFATEIISDYETENREFDKSDNVVKIARQFLNTWERGEHRGGKPPRFYAYKTQYSREPEPIPSCLLREVESLY